MARAPERRTSVALPTDREIVLLRDFDAPRERVFAAWTRPELLARWWGPGRFTLPVCEVDLRPGGAYRFVMRGPDGREFPVGGVYREVVPPERLVYTSRLDLEGAPSFEGTVTATFADRDGRTTLTLRTLYETREQRDAALRMQMAEGYGESFDRLDAALADRRPPSPTA
jgi:uncharacterized protein YndB with AHSA1/START domain